MNKYQETLKWMFQQLPMYQRQGKPAFKKNLDNILALMDSLGNPHQQLKCIHIGGTNGKGSVSHILSALLQSHGYSVGLYTSPHYKDFRERIKINTDLISEEEVIAFIEENREAIERIQPSFFEITVAMAFQHFAQHQPDYVIMEVGLGGRLDSTNIIDPLLSIITNISMDHQSMLGDTLPKIAYEKAGIIKQDRPIIIGEQQKEVEQVFSKKAAELCAPLSYASDCLELSLESSSPLSNRISAEAKDKSWSFKCNTDLYGDYQEKNLKTALAAFIQLSELENIPIQIKAVTEALGNIKALSYMLGRWHILDKKPLTLADSAHNEDGIQQLVKTIESMDYSQLHFIYGTASDKDLNKILPLLPKNAKYYYCKADIPRGKDALELSELGNSYGLLGRAYGSVRQALGSAQLVAMEADLIVVAGSIFVVAEVV